MRAKVPFASNTLEDVTKNRRRERLRRATIATIQDDGFVCVLWEDVIGLAHQVVVDIAAGATTRNIQTSLIVPIFKAEERVEEKESIVPASDITPLLDFETTPSLQDFVLARTTQTETLPSSLAVWKERGDKLLRLGDPSSAALYYETGLQIYLSRSAVSVGSSVIVNVSGHAKIADVDCINDDSLDITLEENQHEQTIKMSDILICILEPDPEQLQERLLLNLARCMLQLADDDDYETSSSDSVKHRSAYWKATVLASTLALTCASHHNPNNQTTLTALLLRGQAHLALSKCSHAMADVKKLLSLSPKNTEGLKLRRDVERRQQQRVNSDKKLVKEICKLVQTATKTEKSSSHTSSVSGTTSSTPADRCEMLLRQQLPSPIPKSLTTNISFYLWVAIILVVVMAWLCQNSFS